MRGQGCPPVPVRRTCRGFLSIGSGGAFMLKMSVFGKESIIFMVFDYFIEIKSGFFVLKEWIDVKLKWNPDDYGGIKVIRVPSDSLWTPDIVLFDK